MKQINLKDSNFSPEKTSSKYGVSNLISWDIQCKQPFYTVYTDNYLNDNIKNISGDKVAWIMEPRQIVESFYGKDIYNWILDNHSLFIEIWTHDDEILNKLPNSKWIPQAGTWIKDTDRKIHSKFKDCSYIASSKNTTTGHKFRQEIRNWLPATIDQFGRGYKDISEKIDALRDYRFSIVVENSQVDTYFTEKIIDCFVTGTVPIYWGTKNISSYFDTKGIIFFETLTDLLNIINSLSNELYESKMDAINYNYKVAIDNFLVGEEWMFKTKKH